MRRVAVVTDSSACLSPEDVSTYGIGVVPLYVNLDNESIPEQALSPAGFYARLARASTLPTTSQPSIGDFWRVYQEISQDAEAILSIHLSGKISGTVNAAKAAAQELANLHIEVLDSRIASTGLALIVLAAARTAAAGGTMAEVLGVAQRIIPQVQAQAIFIVDTLDYLHKGGRIGGAACFVGTLLNVKPLLGFNDGKVDAVGRVRTRARARAEMLERVDRWIGHSSAVHLFVNHACAEEEAAELLREVAQKYPCVEQGIYPFSPAIGAHLGPGALGVVCYGE